MESTTVTTIERPAAEVFELVADMARNPDWQRGMQSCHWTSPPPVGVGSTYDQVATFLGRSIITSFEVVEFEPGHRIRIVSTKSSFPLDITRTVDPLGERSCRVTARVAGEPSGVFGLAEPIIRPLVRWSVRRDYRQLKARLEG